MKAFLLTVLLLSSSIAAAADLCTEDKVNHPFSPYCHDNATGGHDCWQTMGECQTDLSKKSTKKAAPTKASAPKR